MRKGNKTRRYFRPTLNELEKSNRYLMIVTDQFTLTDKNC